MKLTPQSTFLLKSINYSQRPLLAVVDLGSWGDDEIGPEGRVAFPFQIWTDKENFQVGLVNAQDSPWRHITFMGRILNREEALKHEWIKDVFHITDIWLLMMK